MKEISRGCLIFIVVYILTRATSYLYNPRPYLWQHLMLDGLVVGGVLLIQTAALIRSRRGA